MWNMPCYSKYLFIFICKIILMSVFASITHLHQTKVTKQLNIDFSNCNLFKNRGNNILLKFHAFVTLFPSFFQYFNYKKFYNCWISHKNYKNKCIYTICWKMARCNNYIIRLPTFNPKLGSRLSFIYAIRCYTCIISCVGTFNIPNSDALITRKYINIWIREV